MRKILSRQFFNRPAPMVARDLVGKFLVRAGDGTEEAYMIVETEAYCGPEDLASHARFGKTGRNAAMFSHPGTIYVYFTYGMHWMLNIACREEGYPSAVLIRGLAQMGGARPMPRFGQINTLPIPSRATDLAPQAQAKFNGPGKLTKALGIDKSLNSLPLGIAAGLWVEDRGVMLLPRSIKKTPRIGIDYAGAWVKKPLRFVYEEKKARRAGR